MELSATDFGHRRAARWVAVWTVVFFGPGAVGTLSTPLLDSLAARDVAEFALPWLGFAWGLRLATRVRAGVSLDGAFGFMTLVQGIVTSIFLVALMADEMDSTLMVVWNVATFLLGCAGAYAIRAIPPPDPSGVSDIFR